MILPSLIPLDFSALSASTMTLTAATILTTTPGVLAMKLFLEAKPLECDLAAFGR